MQFIFPTLSPFDNLNTGSLVSDSGDCKVGGFPPLHALLTVPS